MSRNLRPRNQESIMTRKIPNQSLTTDGEFSLPESEEEAVRRGIELMRILKFRALRAAIMNYQHSDQYRQTYTSITWWSIVCAAAVTVITLLVKSSHSLSWFPWNEEKIREFFNSLDFFSFFSLIVIIIIVFAIRSAPDILGPHYLKSQKYHNDAGAAWQTLTLKIENFLETSNRKRTSPEIIREMLCGFIEEREKICRMACPEEIMYMKVNKDAELVTKRLFANAKGFNEYKKAENKIKLGLLVE